MCQVPPERAFVVASYATSLRLTETMGVTLLIYLLADTTKPASAQHVSYACRAAVRELVSHPSLRRRANFATAGGRAAHYSEAQPVAELGYATDPSGYERLINQHATV